MLRVLSSRHCLSFRRIFLTLCLVAFTSALPHPQIQKRDIFSTIVSQTVLFIN